MAYVRIGEEESTLGSFGCGPGCSCAGCRQTAVSVNGLGERYVPEEEEAPPPPPRQPPPQRPAPALPPRSNLSGWGRFGEPLLQRRLSPTGGLQLRRPAFATLTGFARGGAGETATRLLSQKKRQPILFGASLTEDLRRKGVGQASMLGQHSPKQLPDWMKTFLMTVDKYYRNHTHLFFILSLHPQPFAVQALRPISNKILSDYVEQGGRGPLPVFWWGELRSELARIRARRQLDDKDFSRLLFEHLQLFQEVDKSFKTFKREDLKPFLIEVLLASGRVGKGVRYSDPKNWRSPTLGTRSPEWNLGKRFVKERLPQALSKRVAESPWYVQEVINAHLANSLWGMANQFQYENPAFRKELEMKEKARVKRP